MSDLRRVSLSSTPDGWLADQSAIDSPPVHTTLPPDWRIQGAVIVVRAIDGHGQRRTTTLYAGDVMTWEAVGMLHTAIADCTDALPNNVTAPRTATVGGETV